tara:strand:- start:337 stop:555 length:219 start_codon:yes stop_codon:yes gene_type:complete
MKYFLIFNLLAITSINPIVCAHENHDHQIYNWSKSKNKSIKSHSIFNHEKLEDKKNKPKTNNNRNWTKIFRR